MFRNIILTVSLCAIVCGCVRPDKVKVADIDPLGWAGKDSVRIEMLNTDTTGLRSIALLVRFDNTFNRDSLPVSVRICTPDSLCFEETFTFSFNNAKRVNNDFFEATLPYRKNVVLNKLGTYVFSIANTGAETRGLWGAGIAIEDN